MPIVRLRGAAQGVGMGARGRWYTLQRIAVAARCCVPDGCLMRRQVARGLEPTRIAHAHLQLQTRQLAIGRTDRRACTHRGRQTDRLVRYSGGGRSARSTAASGRGRRRGSRGRSRPTPPLPQHDAVRSAVTGPGFEYRRRGVASRICPLRRHSEPFGTCLGGAPGPWARPGAIR